MATSYPSGLDTLTNPISTDYQDGVDHAAQHANANDAIEAVQAELGTLPKGSYGSVRARLEQLEAAGGLPAETGYLAFNFAPELSQGSTALGANGTVYAQRLWTPIAISVTNVHLHVGTAGATLTSGQNFAALYNSSKTLLGTSADQTTPWASAGMKTMALSGGPYAVAAGFFYVSVFANATTRPAFARAGNFAIVNGLLSTANSKWATADTGRTTTMPATMGAFTAAVVAYWAGVS